MDVSIEASTLEQLEQIKEESMLLLKAQRNANLTQLSMDELRLQIAELTKYRDLLVATLDEETQDLVPDTEYIIPPNKIDPSHISPLVRYRDQLAEAEQLLLAHRLTGRSVFHVPEDPSLLGYRLDTFFDGSFQAPFYLFIGLNDEKQICLRHHTLPPEIPIESLESQHLPDSLPDFIDALEDRLQAFIKKNLKTT